MNNAISVTAGRALWTAGGWFEGPFQEKSPNPQTRDSTPKAQEKGEFKRLQDVERIWYLIYGVKEWVEGHFQIEEPVLLYSQTLVEPYLQKPKMYQYVVHSQRSNMKKDRATEALQ